MAMLATQLYMDNIDTSTFTYSIDSVGSLLELGFLGDKWQRPMGFESGCVVHPNTNVWPRAEIQSTTTTSFELITETGRRYRFHNHP